MQPSHRRSERSLPCGPQVSCRQVDPADSAKAIIRATAPACRSHSRHPTVSRDLRRTLPVLLSIGAIALATLSPQPPLATSSHPLCVFCGDIGAVDFLLNIGLFVPLGFALAVRGASLRKGMGIVAATTLAVELLQLRIIPGRDASLGDLLANSIGGLAGMVLWHARLTLLRPLPAAGLRLCAAGSAAPATILVLTALALLPRPTTARHFLQFYPERPQFDAFGGRVLALTIDSLALPVYRRPASYELTVHPAGPNLRIHAVATAGHAPRRVAPIIRIVSGPDESAMLGRRRDDLVFRRRLQATIWKLRTPIVAAADVFRRCVDGWCAPAAQTDTIEVAAITTPSGIALSVTAHGETRSGTFSPSVGLGWSMLLPFDLPLRSRHGIWSALWLAALFTPASYWAAWAARREAAAPWRLAAPLIVVAAAVGGFVVAPLIVGFPLTPAHELAGAAAGGVLGAVLGTLAMRMAG